MPIYPVKGVKEIKLVKLIYFDIFVSYSTIITHGSYGYVTNLPPGGNDAKVVIAFKSPIVYIPLGS